MSTPRLAYLLKKFPRLSETFVLNEILGQERLGADVHVFSRRPVDDEPRHPELARLKATCEELPSSKEIDPWRVLLAPDAGDLMERVRGAMDSVRHLEHPRVPSLLAEAIHLLRRCEELGVAHVHAHFATDSAMTALLLHALGGPSFSVTCHAKDIYRSTVNPAQLAAILAHSAFVVTVCDANVAHVRSLVGGAADGKLRRLYNGIELSSFARPSSAPEPGHVLAVGRLVEKKGFDVLVEALALLRERGTRFRATIAGDGDQRGAIAARVAELGLGELVTLTGPVDQDSVRDLFDRAEVFALPCLIGEDGNRDALPTVLLEAQAAGVPIVSTPVSGIPEILDGGEAGLLVPQRDPAATADAIERLLTDGELRARLARAGRARSSSLFDVHENAQVLKGWFDGAMEEASARCVSST